MLALVGFVGLSLLVVGADTAMTAGVARSWFLSLTRPPGTLPNPILGPAWAVLSVTIGIAGWLVWRRSGTVRPLRLWGWQLAASAFWIPAFFALRSPLLALAICLVLMALTLQTTRAFARIQREAAWLMAPYLAWTAYTGYLTAGFWWLNPI